MNKELFYSELSKDLKKKFGTSVEKALPWQLHESLSATVMELIDSDWENSRKAHLDSRRACYLSMEFLRAEPFITISFALVSLTRWTSF